MVHEINMKHSPLSAFVFASLLHLFSTIFLYYNLSHFNLPQRIKTIFPLGRLFCVLYLFFVLQKNRKNPRKLLFSKTVFTTKLVFFGHDSAFFDICQYKFRYVLHFYGFWYLSPALFTL